MSKEERKIRVLLTKSQMDGHDRGIRYVAEKLREAGMEIIFTRYAVAGEIVNIATEEDVDVIGIGFSVGGLTRVTSQVVGLLKEHNLDNVLVIVGGLIPEDEVPQLLQMGVGKTFGANSQASDIVEYITSHVRRTA